MGKTNALNEDDLAEFVSLQETKADSDNSWTVKVSDLNANSYDLTVKNPNKVEVVDERTPEEILAHLRELNAQSSTLLNEIEKMI